MPAQMIRPIVAGSRPLFLVQDVKNLSFNILGSRNLGFNILGFRILCLGLAIMLLLGTSAVSAVEAPSRPSLEQNSFYLSSAGFRIQVANDPAGQRALHGLPAHRSDRSNVAASAAIRSR